MFLKNINGVCIESVGIIGKRCALFCTVGVLCACEINKYYIIIVYHLLQ